MSFRDEMIEWRLRTGEQGEEVEEEEEGGVEEEEEEEGTDR